jgi:outer membrane protein assembly factor BamB
MALTPASQLLVFKPDAKGYSEVAKIKVAETPTYAYPVASGNRIYIRDQAGLTAYTVQ